VSFSGLDLNVWLMLIFFAWLFWTIVLCRRRWHFQAQRPNVFLFVISSNFFILLPAMETPSMDSWWLTCQCESLLFRICRHGRSSLVDCRIKGHIIFRVVSSAAVRFFASSALLVI
jgi:hypothetical protein